MFLLIALQWAKKWFHKKRNESHTGILEDVNRHKQLLIHVHIVESQNKKEFKVTS